MGSGDEVPLPGGLRGVLHQPASFKTAAIGPDEWRGILQVAVDLGGVATGTIALGLITNWLYDKLKGKHETQAPTQNVDQSDHIDVRVFIGRFEVNLSDRGQVERVLGEAIAGRNAPTEVPPQVRQRLPPFLDPSDYDDQGWVDRFVEHSTDNG